MGMQTDKILSWPQGYLSVNWQQLAGTWDSPASKWEAMPKLNFSQIWGSQDL